MINVIGGPPGPERNGGLWRPVKWWMFLYESETKKPIPGYLCQVLHSLDFNIHGETWDRWTSQPFGQWINEWQRNVNYTVMPTWVRYKPNEDLNDNGFPFRSFMEHWDFWRDKDNKTHDDVSPPVTFLDSGGFTLLNPKAAEKADRWYDLRTDPSAILELQTKLGGDLIASLDLPIPPGIPHRVAWERQKVSIENAMTLLELISDPNRKQTNALPYLAIHGNSWRNGLWYVGEMAKRWADLPSEAKSRPFGLAIGSLVPRADDPRTIVEIVFGLMKGVEKWESQLGGWRPPIHTFGISSHMMAFLVYMGVDTFDSSTFAEVAQRGNWLDADLRAISIHQVTEEQLAACGCDWCSGILEMNLLDEVKRILKHGRPRKEGNYNTLFGDSPHRVTNSDLYALLAMHNWARLEREIEIVRQAVREDRLAEHICELVHTHMESQRGAKLHDALLWLIQPERHHQDMRLASAYHGVFGQLPEAPSKRRLKNEGKGLRKPGRPEMTAEQRAKRMSRFEIPERYTPPRTKKTLLLMACSKEKPYVLSAHQKPILERLYAHFPQPVFKDQLHRVTLSGLYGPVPEELEGQWNVRDYDYMLTKDAVDQQAEVESRLRTYLKKYAEHYEAIYALVYFPGYHDVLQKVAADYGVRLIPAHAKRGSKPSEHLKELVQYLAVQEDVEPVSQDDMVLKPLKVELSRFERDLLATPPSPGSDLLLVLSPPVSPDQALFELAAAFPGVEVTRRVHTISLVGPEGGRLPFSSYHTKDLVHKLHTYLSEYGQQFCKIVGFVPDDWARDYVNEAFALYRPEASKEQLVKVIYRPEDERGSWLQLALKIKKSFGVKRVQVQTGQGQFVL